MVNHVLIHNNCYHAYMLVWFGAKVSVAIVTNARYDVEVFIDLLVNGGSDYPDSRVGVGHGVETKLSR